MTHRRDNLDMTRIDALVSVDEYLHTVYRPDYDYVDGELADRNVGEKNHADAQGEIFLTCACAASSGISIQYRKREWMCCRRATAFRTFPYSSGRNLTSRSSRGLHSFVLRFCRRKIG
jgi:hypothetical protein